MVDDPTDEELKSIALQAGYDMVTWRPNYKGENIQNSFGINILSTIFEVVEAS